MRSVEEAFAALLAGFVVGDGQKPAGGGWQGAPGTSEFVGYVFWRPGVGLADGTLAVADSHVERMFSVTCVGRTRSGASTLSKNVITAVSGQRIETESRVTTAPITVERWGPVDLDPTVQPSVFMAVHLFRVDTVPV